MAITLAEARGFLMALLVEFDEDYMTQARIFRVLRAQFPGVDWAAELRSRAAAHPRFVQSGLSVTWWCSEIVRLAG